MAKGMLGIGEAVVPGSDDEAAWCRTLRDAVAGLVPQAVEMVLLSRDGLARCGFGPCGRKEVEHYAAAGSAVAGLARQLSRPGPGGGDVHHIEVRTPEGWVVLAPLGQEVLLVVLPRTDSGGQPGASAVGDIARLATSLERQRAASRPAAAGFARQEARPA
ncbi:roadblock/LC7 domain-containing protein [Streptomyces sp. DSM 44917]|uniref:Roadblock/LC7 domain-containing protein n=1 Tax=Streptomyces boetiae TaxID=3075541 RepID=A0ABU2L8B7_9ACTN|nr:roadblock/LC7 domain-containing protein [Streptomyces sp. DSM 44917]MDT0307740.1 roadblock/LC7 domain-containing protein [Streptomyces sp. DSM 44917]